MTLPEVQTLLDGITVGGHKISDQNMALNQAAAWKHLFALVSEGSFSFSKEAALGIHKIAGKEEALGWGAFRTGNMTISGSEYEPPSPTELDTVWGEIKEFNQLMLDFYSSGEMAAMNQFLRRCINPRIIENFK